jgi:4-amino-4-deoxy-L-arabinose transferase-like glycosyltransferase
MNSEALTDRLGGRRLAFEAATAFALALGFLFALAPGAPFTKELGVCECGAVRDALAGSVILPHYTPGTPVQVPPMYWWLAAIAVHFSEWNEIALRAPSMLAVAITAALIYAWMASAASRRAAVWSVPILLSTQYVVDAARQPRMDALLMMFLGAAMVSLERGMSGHPKRKALLAVAALAMGGAVLTKGPIGLVLPALALVIFLAYQRRLRELFGAEIIVTFVVAAAIGALWYLAALQVGGKAFFQFQVVHGLFRRFLGASAGTIGECQNPFYYYLPRLVSGFLPWSLFYPALVVALRKDRGRIPPPLLFALCWFVAILGFFTISAGKCLVYILPLFPALAALTAWLIVDMAKWPRASNLARKLFDWASIAIGVGGLIMVIFALAISWSGIWATVGARLHSSDRRSLELLMAALTSASPMVFLWIILWLAGGILVLGAVARGRSVAQSAGVALIALAGTRLWYGFLNPAIANEVTLKSYAGVVDREVPAGLPIDYLGPFDCDLAFYSDHQIGSINKFQCAPESHEQYFLVWQDRLVAMTRDQRACLTPLAQSAAVDRHGIRVLMVEKK